MVGDLSTASALGAGVSMSMGVLESGVSTSAAAEELSATVAVEDSESDVDPSTLTLMEGDECGPIAKILAH